MTPIGNNPIIKEANIKLNLFPKTDYRQSVIDFDTYSEPDIYIDVDDVIQYSWEDLKVEQLSFGLDSKVIITNEIKRIKNKISFPLDDLWGNENYIETTENIDITKDISNKANEIASGETDLFVVAYKLAEWVRKNIKYDINTLTEKVDQRSSWVFENKEGVCDEITNLFISFCRSVGIPAKFVAGVVYSDETKDWGNHGWAEVYFPGDGWLPFDVTFGQYGWIDATHLKLAEGYDSNEYTAQYGWRSREINIEPQPLKIKTKILDKGNLINPYLNIKLNLFSNEVGYGSAVPLQATIENPNEFYLSTKVAIVKAPAALEDNTKVILLKPKEIKNIYWVLDVPKDLDSDYLYTSLIKVIDSFSGSSEAVLKFSDEYDIYSKREAEEKVNKLIERENKVFFSGVEVNCLTEKEYYYSNENIELSCTIKNKGNTYLNDISACLKDDCKITNLAIGGKEEFKFKTSANEKVTIITESKEMIKYYTPDLNIIKIPDVYVTSVNPKEADYSKKGKLTLTLYSDNKAYDVDVLIKGNEFKINELKGEKEILVDIDGKELLGGLQVKINYKDEIGKVYTKDQNYNINLINVPWYGRILNWFFSMI